MPEAVIVATARSPIGRAGKGSLKDVRPDDLAATMVRAALDKVPALDPHTINDVYLGCGLPGGESGFNMARVVNILNEMDDVPAATISRYCASSVQTTRMAFHAIKAGEGDVFVSAGVETVSRTPRAPPTAGRTPTTRCCRGRGAHRRGGPGRYVVARPSRRRRRPRHLHGHGPDGREPRPVPRHHPQVLYQFGVRSQNLAEKAIADGFWAREIVPVTTPDGTVVPTDDGPRAGVPTRRSPTSSRCSGRTGWSRPATVPAQRRCRRGVVMSDTRAAELGRHRSLGSSPPA